MIQITPHMRIMLAVEPADFRKGIDGLTGIVKQALQSDPFDGTLFVFRNKSRTAVKIISYDGQGFWLCQKRLSRGRFNWWPEKLDRQAQLLAAHEVQLLLWNGNPEAASAVLWKKISPRQFFAGHT